MLKRSISIFLGVSFAFAADLKLLEGELRKAQRSYDKIYYSTYGRGACGDKEPERVRKLRIAAEATLNLTKKNLTEASPPSYDGIK